MSLVFNEAALNRLLQNPDGPVGRKLERTAIQITQNYGNVTGIIWQNQDMSLKPQADYTVSSGDNGLQAVIGILDEGSISEYMDRKFVREQDWIVPNLMANWDGV
jgi:hypothetical protein